MIVLTNALQKKCYLFTKKKMCYIFKEQLNSIIGIISQYNHIVEFNRET